MKAKDWAMYILGALTAVGFFILLGLLVFQAIPESNNELLYLSVGALITGFTTVINYFYGSSAGSAQKTEAMLKNNGEK